MRIVIADDELKEHKLLEILIGRASLDAPAEIVGRAENGREALALVAEQEPDVLITDIRMPGLTGLELIRAVREQNRELFIIVISGYEMFEYAHEAIQYGVEDYLLKPLRQRELEAALQKIADKMSRADRQSEVVNELRKSRQQLLLRRLISPDERMLTREPLTRELLREQYACEITDALVCIVLLKVDAPAIVDNKECESRLGKRISHSVAKCMIRYFGKMIYYSEGGLCIFLIQSQEDVSGQLRKDLQELIYEIRTPDIILGNLHVTAVLGAPCAEVDRLPECTRQLALALENRLVTGADRVLDCSAQTGTLRLEDYIDGTFRKKLISDLETNQAEEALDSIRKLWDQMLAGETAGGHLLLSAAAEFIDILFFAVKEAVPAEELNRRKTVARQQLEHCHTPEELIERIGEIIRTTLLYSQGQRADQASKPIEEVKRYIRKHYADNISQVELAALVDLNPAYLSTLFKKEMGISFSEYLTQTRIYAACNMLSTSNDPIDVIAENVGYTDTRYFSRIFKKVMKLSPGEYRKLY